MSNEKLLKEIQNMVRVLPFKTLSGFHLNTRAISQPSIPNIRANDDRKDEKNEQKTD